MGNAQVITNYWTFIQIVDLENVVKQFIDLQSQYHTLKFNLSKDETYAKEYFNSHNIANNLENTLINQLEQINPTSTISNYKRDKRGLINGLGSIIKFLTGNLHQQDAEKYDEHINKLYDNQNKIKYLLNNQITILNTSMDTFNELSQNLTHNQIVLKTKILQIESAIKTNALASANRFQILLIQMILNQITSMFRTIYAILDKVEVAISFAKLNTLHNSIIKPIYLLTELKSMYRSLIDVKLIVL